MMLELCQNNVLCLTQGYIRKKQRFTHSSSNGVHIRSLNSIFIVRYYFVIFYMIHTYKKTNEWISFLFSFYFFQSENSQTFEFLALYKYFVFLFLDIYDEKTFFNFFKEQQKGHVYYPLDSERLCVLRMVKMWIFEIIKVLKIIRFSFAVFWKIKGFAF